MNVLDFQKMKNAGRRISMVTCYDYSSARAVADSDIDCILVGDSLAMVMHGHPTTLSATTAMMALHTAAVARGAPTKFIVADLPFLSYRKGLKEAMDSVQELMSAGAHAVKLEGVRGHADIVRHIVESGVAVMGHLGLTPQSVHALGGYRVQGREDAEAGRLKADAAALQDAGAFAVVLELVPAPLASQITKALTIPTIGIGAGPACDGQVLVVHDMLGLNDRFSAKFVKKYAALAEDVREAARRFAAEVREGRFPGPDHSFGK